MYKRSEHGWLKHLDFIILDALCAQGALLLAYGFRFRFVNLAYDEPFYRTMAVWIALFGVLIAIVFNTMHNVLHRGWLTEIRQTVTQSALVFASLIIYLFSVKDSENASRIVAWLMLIIYTVLAYGVRMLWKWLLLHRRSNRNGRAMLLVADEATAEKTIARFRAHSIENINVCGIVLVDRDAKGETVSGIPVSANLDEAAQYICREWIDEVYISVADSSLLPHTLMAQCGEMGVTLHLQMPALGAGKQVIEKVAGKTVITSSINFASPLQLVLKRIMDLLSGLILSLLALLAITFIGPIIKKKSPGPILYKQERIGQNGRRFKMYKIRSMYLDADARKQELMSQNRVTDGRMFKMEFDPRIIGNEVLPDGTRKYGIGEFIRKWSIDELPQGFNLLLNQMSLVGTRPPTVDEWEKYELHHRARLATKPGITGLWQVSGRSDITDFEEVTRLDTEYISNWSIWLDIKIILDTFLVILKRRGAM